MKRIVGNLGVVVLALGSLLSTERVWAREMADYKDALVKRLSFIFKDEKLDKTHIGVEVFSLTNQESLFKLNADEALSPASAIKLLTAVVALKKLGPDFVYHTQIYTDGTLQKGVLKGNLYLKGSGDPSFTTERLFLLCNQLLHNGIKSVTGSIVVDDWSFDQNAVDPGRIPTESDKPYNAIVGGLSFNFNSTAAFFRPGDTVGSKPNVFVEPDTGYVKIVNNARTSSRGGAYALVANRAKGTDGDTIVVKGNIPLGMPEQRTGFNVTNPPIYAGSALRYMLTRRGVLISNPVIKHAEVPPSARKIADLESLPLREIVVLMNKFSNNFIADTLVKTLGRELKGPPGTMDKGLQVLLEEATKMNLNTAGFRVVSGSGLTRDNRMTASQFITLLNSAWLDFDVLPEVLSSLSIAGKDGTLRKRMKGTSAYGRLRGKTGTIDGVSTLVGVVQTRGGELLAFSVLMNDRTKVPGSMHAWQNYFAQALADFNRKTPMTEKPAPIPDSMEEDSKEESEIGVR